MKVFTPIKSILTPLDKVNVDTDQIIPKQFLKLIQRTGFGEFLFYDWRFNTDGTEKEEFVLNSSKFRDSKILLTWDNFGCGSSREHAAWALLDYGFRVVIAPSFADIFYNNCFKNGILPITLDKETIEGLFREESEFEIDLETQTISSQNKTIQFEIDSHRKKILLEGLDDISLTLKHESKITEFEQKKAIY